NRNKGAQPWQKQFNVVIFDERGNLIFSSSAPFVTGNPIYVGVHAPITTGPCRLSIRAASKAPVRTCLHRHRFRVRKRWQVSGFLLTFRRSVATPLILTS